MTADLRLIIFDVDGTLVDSQGDIVASMSAAFDAEGHPVPDRAQILSIVGLSLDVAMPKLISGLDDAAYARMVEAYKSAYMQLRASQGTKQSSPLYPGIRAVLDELNAVPEFLLGVATGKSRRGLDALLAGHQMERLFLTQQVADHHPSKPHPAMLEAALAETGLSADQAVMIGDTEFDMAMAQAAGMRAIGVSWGYHAVDRLDAADKLVHSVADLPAAIRAVWE
jgi:phosphoglycolate phosphatase